MKLIIAGSRTITMSNDFIHSIVEHICYKFSELEIISGTAKGIDTVAIEYAEEFGWALKKFPADWDKFGKAAGHIRNKQMAEEGDALLLIWTGDKETSPGSYSMKQAMLFKKKPVYEVILKKHNV